MFTKKGVTLVKRSEALRTGLEKVCDDYLNTYFSFKTHAPVARIIKEELASITGEYKDETEEFKLTWIQFLVATLLDYLQLKNSQNFLTALRDLCNLYGKELNNDCLTTCRLLYPVTLFKDYLTQQQVACLWVQQGRIKEFQERYDFYRKNSPTASSIPRTNVTL